MDIYRAAKDLPKALQAGKEAVAKYPGDLPLRSSEALLLGESGQTDEGVKMLRTQLTGKPGDREVYLNIAQVYERGRHYKEAEEAAKAAEVLPGQPRDNEMVWFLLGAIYERQKFFDRAEEQFKKVLGRESPQRAGAQLLRLHAGRSRHSPRRSRISGPARAEGRTFQRRLSRQPRLDLPQAK